MPIRFITSFHFTFLVVLSLAVFTIGFFIPREIFWDLLYIPIILLAFVKLDRGYYIIISLLFFLFFFIRQIRLPYSSEHNWIIIAFNILLIVVVLWSILYVLVRLSQYYRTNREEKDRLLTIINNATIGIIITDRYGRIVLINPFVTQKFGYEDYELLGETVEKMVPDEFKMNHKSLREKFQQSPRNRPMGQGMRLYALHKNGQTVPVEISLGYYNIDKNIYVIAFINDITQQVESENRIIEQNKVLSQITEALKVANAQLEMRVNERTKTLHDTVQKLLESNAILEREVQERIHAQEQLTLKQNELSEALKKEKELGELKSRFVSMASHEFRTPLSAILSSASLIGKYKLTEQQPLRERHIQKIKDSINVLTGILNDFLSHGKIEEGKIILSPREINLRHFLENIVIEVKNLLKEGQWIENEFILDRDEIFTDPKLLHAICVNLLSNGIKYSHKDMPIQFHAKLSDGNLTIKVADKGIGIPQDDQKHLFERFFRANNAIHIQGTGLGLSIVKSYVELLGGKISYYSVENVGSQFIVEINV